MVHVIATVTAKPGCRDRWLAAFLANRPKVLAEVGCQRYDVHFPIDPKLPGRPGPSEDVAIILETWDSVDALHAHLQQPHMKSYGEAVKDLVAKPTDIQVLGEMRT